MDIVTTAPDQAIKTAMPDLRDVPLGEADSAALYAAIRLYRERMRESGMTLSSFQARI